MNLTKISMRVALIEEPSSYGLSVFMIRNLLMLAHPSGQTMRLDL